MIQKKPIKFFFNNSEGLFKVREGFLSDSEDVDMAINCLFDTGFRKATQSPKPLVQKSIRLYKITDSYIICNIVKYDYFCNTIRGHLKIYSGKNIFTYIKTNDVFYDTGYKSKKEIESIQSFYERKKGAPENNGID